MRDYRIIPTLLLKNGRIVKGERFQNHQYVGSPINTVGIFNELKADELFLLDIEASKLNKEPDYPLLSSIGVRSFMPLAYGGGIKSVEQAKRILSLGFEKVVVNSEALNRPQLITELADRFGSQAVVASIDYIMKNSEAVVSSLLNRKDKQIKLNEWAMKCQSLGAGEILVTSVDKEGTWSGIDENSIKQLTDNLTIPLICQGGINSLQNITHAIEKCNASAVAVGSMFVYSQHKAGVLINYPQAQSPSCS